VSAVSEETVHANPGMIDTVGERWTVDQRLSELVTRPGADSMQIDVLFEGLTGLEATAAPAAFQAFSDALRATDGPDLAMRPGGWVIDLKKGIASAAVVGAIAVGLLAGAGYHDLPAVVIPAVAPVLFAANPVRISRSRKALLAEIRLNPDLVDRPLTIDALYAGLPAKVKRQVNKLDFTDVVDDMIGAGHMDEKTEGRVTVRPRGHDRWLRIRID
jgi:hypothetical protein